MLFLNFVSMVHPLTSLPVTISFMMLFKICLQSRYFRIEYCDILLHPAHLSLHTPNAALFLSFSTGLLDDAATIFRECGRFDMLNKLYQSAGLWDKAIATATSKDRIHLKTTHYQYARHLGEFVLYVYVCVCWMCQGVDCFLLVDYISTSCSFDVIC